MNVKIKRAKKRDAVYVFTHMRAEDEREVRTSLPFGTDMQAVLLAGFDGCSVAYTIEVDGKTVAVLGLLPTALEVSVVWMLCTDDIRLAPRVILGRCKDIAAKWYRRFGALVCICDNRNDLHLRWLDHLGFIKQGEVLQNGEPYTQLLYTGGVPFATPSPSQARP